MKISTLPSLCAKAQTLLSLIILGAIPSAHAEFALNFQPVPDTTPGGLYMDCQRGAAADTRCQRGDSSQDPDQTPFYQEIISDGTNIYYHDIIGDPDSGFAIEYFIRAGGCCWAGQSDAPLNASGGTFNGGLDATPEGSADFVDPLGSDSNLTGNATGNPERVIFRQIVRDEQMDLEIIKETLSNKPKISQIIDDGVINNTFVFDMSNIGYSDIDTAGILINHVVINDPDLPTNGLIDFDIIADSQFTNITGGKYSYTPNPNGSDGSNGTYDYADGDFDINNVDWSIYWDPTINVPNTP